MKVFFVLVCLLFCGNVFAQKVEIIITNPCSIANRSDYISGYEFLNSKIKKVSFCRKKERRSNSITKFKDGESAYYLIENYTLSFYKDIDSKYEKFRLNAVDKLDLYDIFALIKIQLCDSIKSVGISNSGYCVFDIHSEQLYHDVYFFKNNKEFNTFSGFFKPFVFRLKAKHCYKLARENK